MLDKFSGKASHQVTEGERQFTPRRRRESNRDRKRGRRALESEGEWAKIPGALLQRADPIATKRM